MTVRERPILFAGSMVRAILAGTKRQTRRVATYWRGKGADARKVPCDLKPTWPPAFGVSPSVVCPFGAPGDRLWVRETWSAMLTAREGDLVDVVRYAATDRQPRDHRGELVRWRPSIHMPRAASRLSLEVTAVRVERLQAITEADAYDEGIADEHLNPIAIFHGLWDHINGKRAPWHSNPWVWVVSFRRLEAAC